MATLQSNPMDERDMQDVLSDEDSDKFSGGDNLSTHSKARPKPPNSLAIMPGKF